MKLTRRTILSALAGLPLIPVGMGVYTWRIEPHWVEFVRRKMPLPDLPSELENKTVVQISDVHVGPQVDSGYLISTLKAVQEIEPDVLLLTGDFVSYESPQQVDELARVMDHLPQGTLGTFGVLGNHDYGFGWRMQDVADRIVTCLANYGVKVLRNEQTSVSGLPVIGLDDMWSPNFDPASIVDNVDREQSSIILCHNPDAADQPVWNGIKGWILAGHTHGGQCKLPFLPPPILPVKNRRYTSGAFDLQEGLKMYINRGLGHLTRVRFNARPEVTVFMLTKAL